MLACSDVLAQPVVHESDLRGLTERLEDKEICFLLYHFTAQSREFLIETIISRFHATVSSENLVDKQTEVLQKYTHSASECFLSSETLLISGAAGLLPISALLSFDLNEVSNKTIALTLMAATASFFGVLGGVGYYQYRQTPQQRVRAAYNRQAWVTFPLIVAHVKLKAEMDHIEMKIEKIRFKYGETSPIFLKEPKVFEAYFTQCIQEFEAANTQHKCVREFTLKVKAVNEVRSNESAVKAEYDEVRSAVSRLKDRLKHISTDMSKLKKQLDEINQQAALRAVRILARDSKTEVSDTASRNRDEISIKSQIRTLENEQNSTEREIRQSEGTLEAKGKELKSLKLLREQSELEANQAEQKIKHDDEKLYEHTVLKAFRMIELKKLIESDKASSFTTELTRLVELGIEDYLLCGLPQAASDIHSKLMTKQHVNPNDGIETLYGKLPEVPTSLTPSAESPLETKLNNDI